MNSTSEDRRVDLLIDRVVARRMAGSDAGRARDEPGPDEALIIELSRLGEIDWPADEVGDRIAENVAAAAGQHAAVCVPPASVVRGRGRRAGARYPRSGKSRWIAAGVAAAAALALAGVVQLTGGSHAAARHLSGPTAAGQKKTARATPPGAKAHGATRTWLTAMRVVSQPGELKSVGTADINDNFLTCVTSSVCYTLGGDNSADIARSVNGGVTWASGQPLPPTNGQFDSQAAVSCPRPLTCFLPYGTDVLATRDGFAHYQVLPVRMPSGTTDQVSQVSCPTTQHCIAAAYLGNGQGFIYSDDGGVSWNLASSPAVSADDRIDGLHCDPDGACIAEDSAGQAGDPLLAALSSTDGGRSWIISATYTVGQDGGFTVSCGDGRNCLVGTDDGYLAWIHAAASGRISIRVGGFPSNWGSDLIAVSCAAGSDCFAATADNPVPGLNGPTLYATRDAGLTWTSTPMVASGVTESNLVYLSCPVAAGCIAMANDGNGDASSWSVLSDLHNPG